MRRDSSRNLIVLSKKIGRAILEKYRLDRSFSTLWPEAEEWVVEKVQQK